MSDESWRRGARLSPTTTARTALYGLVGWPVERSLSPRIHSVAIGHLGLDAVYVPIPVPPGELNRAMDGLSLPCLRGLNVTAPYKEAVIPLLAGTTALAAGVGAVNVVYRDEAGRLWGDNTDVGGLELAIEGIGVDLEGETAVVVGAGGAAAAAVVALGRLGAARVFVTARRIPRAEALARRLESSGLCRGVHIGVEELPAAGLLARAGVIVQATSAPPLGPPALDPSRGRAGALAVDLVYHPGRPGETSFLGLARRRGMLAVDGLPMLVWQAALSWKRWKGRALPPACVRSMREVALIGE